MLSGVVEWTENNPNEMGAWIVLLLGNIDDECALLVLLALPSTTQCWLCRWLLRKMSSGQHAAAWLRALVSRIKDLASHETTAHLCVLFCAQRVSPLSLMLWAYLGLRADVHELRLKDPHEAEVSSLLADKVATIACGLANTIGPDALSYELERPAAFAAGGSVMQQAIQVGCKPFLASPEVRARPKALLVPRSHAQQGKGPGFLEGPSDMQV